MISKWRKSTFSGGQGNCVEVRFTRSGGADVRDSKARRRGPVLHFTAKEWAAFLAGAKAGEFDK